MEMWCSGGRSAAVPLAAELVVWLAEDGTSLRSIYSGTKPAFTGATTNGFHYRVFMITEMDCGAYFESFHM